MVALVLTTAAKREIIGQPVLWASLHAHSAASATPEHIHGAPRHAPAEHTLI
jgi:hypothetical protein